MADRTALKVGAVVVGTVLLFLLLRTLLGWFFRLATLFGAALLAVALAYVAYRIWIAPGERDDATATDASRGAGLETELGDAARGVEGNGDDVDAVGLSDEEFERELEEIRDDS